MKPIADIESELFKNRQELNERLDKGFYMYECVCDYYRGWVEALKWVLELNERERYND